MARMKPLIVLGILLGIASIVCFADWYIAIPADTQATYVGRSTCAQCHQQEAKAWQGSHHDHAMELATEDTVRGDFNNAVFFRNETSTRFFKKQDKYYCNTEGPDGKNHDYEIKYVFGYEPLQQYMVEFERGRIQVLRVSWDTEKEKWFYVPPPDVLEDKLEPDDPLHWTGIAQNWNTMCAECHSTNLQKNYDLETDTYHTTYSEIDVSCESCHGPGSIHVELAQSNSIFWDRNHGYGLARLKEESNKNQVDSCAPCHSRRSMIDGGYEAGDPFSDHFHLSLLEPGLYHADGQILDEVYVYGSFLQSRMYHENVKCSDCHDPHSLKLKFQGNLLCTQCHQTYDAKRHHHHTDPKATLCVNCHMTESHYMVIDGRRDHSFRIPRPDLSVKLGTPNACTGCHNNPWEGDQWAADAIKKWYGDKRPNDPHYAPALNAAWDQEPDAVEKVRELFDWKPPLPGKKIPDIVKATALRALDNIRSKESDALCLEALEDKNPVVIAAAVRSFSEAAVDQNTEQIAKLLEHESLMVRNAATERIVGRTEELTGSYASRAIQFALEDYFKKQDVMADRAATHLRRAMIYQSLGENDKAIEAFTNARKVEPFLAGPRSEMARLLAEQGGDPEEIRKLREEEVKLLARDCDLLPGSAQTRYRLGLLLYLLGRHSEAIVAFEQATEIDPDNYDLWLPLALLYEKEERWNEAFSTLKRMNELRPNDPAILGILQRIQQTRGIVNDPPKTESDTAEEKSAE